MTGSTSAHWLDHIVAKKVLRPEARTGMTAGARSSTMINAAPRLRLGAPDLDLIAQHPRTTH